MTCGSLIVCVCVCVYSCHTLSATCINTHNIKYFRLHCTLPDRQYICMLTVFHQISTFDIIYALIPYSTPLDVHLYYIMPLLWYNINAIVPLNPYVYNKNRSDHWFTNSSFCSWSITPRNSASSTDPFLTVSLSVVCKYLLLLWQHAVCLLL